MIEKKHNFFIIFLIFFIFFFSNIKAELKIIAKIDNEIITNYDIKSKIISTLILANKEINQKNIDSLKSNSLEFLIQHKLKKIELEKYDLKRDTTKINSYLNSISSNNINNLKKIFENYNIDFKSFEDEIDIEIKWKSFIYKKFSNKIEINQNEIKKEIENKINQEKSSKYLLSEIEIIRKNSQDDKNLIAEIQKEIEINGFKSAVLKFSVSSTNDQEGLLGWINSESVSAEFLEVLEGLKIGEISPPINKQESIIILKLNDKKTLKNENIAKLEKELIEKKQNELFNLYSKSFLSKLKNNKFIEFY